MFVAKSCKSTETNHDDDTPIVSALDVGFHFTLLVVTAPWNKCRRKKREMGAMNEWGHLFFIVIVFVVVLK